MTRTVSAARRFAAPSQEQIVLVAILIATAIFAVLLPTFLTLGNIFALARSISILGILSLGMGIVVIARGVDLSQIAIMASTAGITAVMLNSGVPLVAALVAGLALALAIGALNGFMIAYVEIPALFATLASGLLVVGVTRALVMPQLLVYLNDGETFVGKLGENLSWGLPVPLIVFAVLALLVHLFLSHTTVGRFIYAHGDNADAARMTGISVRPLTMLEYAVSGAIGYVGGLVMLGSTSLMHLQVVDSTLIFDVILVVVLGGISLVGGRGSVGSVLVGALLIGVLLNGMTILNLDTQTQDICKGVVLLAAIVIDSFLHRKDDETAKQGE
ncbi:MAG: ABC transporter permease [Paenirhodobacter sp.]|uniref:ABC transporter permease n=1 Tax=Paenirhodobacter sp. TaxID=1965326 RepID=UPI003D10CF0A